MATEDVSSIRASGGDYTTLSNWEATEQKDLVSADQIAVAELYNDWTGDGLQDSLAIGGWTMDSTRYAVVRAASGAGTQGASKHAGTWNSGARYWKSVAGYLTTVQQYCRLEGVQAYNANAAAVNWYNALYVNVADVTIDGCLFRAAFTGAGGFAVNLNAARGIIKNSAAIGSPAAGGIRCAGTGIYHCVAANNGGGGFAGTNGVVVSHSAAYGNTGADYANTGSWGGSSTYNADEDSTAPASNRVTLSADPFTNSAAGDYTHGAASALTDAGGATGAGISVDCIGTARPQNTNYDIGWFEYLATGGGTTVTPWYVAFQ